MSAQTAVDLNSCGTIGLTKETAATLLNSYNCCFLRTDSPKRPQGKNWQKNSRRPSEWETGTGVGVICGSVAGLSVHGLDVDAKSDVIADQMRKHIWELVALRPGKKLIRVGLPPKFLIPFTMKEPIRKQQTAAYCPGGDERSPNKNLLEILGTGNQFVAYQIHPDTKQPYEWFDLETGELDDLHNYKPSDLVQLTQADLDKLKSLFIEAAESEGLEVSKREKKARTAQPKLFRRGTTEESGIIDMVNNDHRSMSDILENYGYEEKEKNRHLYPYSSTGDPGVVVFVDGGKERCYSHHTSDPLSDGYSHDKFSVITVLEYDGNASAAVRALASEVDPEGQKERQQEYAKEQHAITVDDLPAVIERSEKKKLDNMFSLPDFPPQLLALPGYLGKIQRFAHGRMTYPSQAAAGMVALATLTAFAQTNITIKSRDGLGFNEYYLFLMPTGFGKEDLRKPPEILGRRATITLPLDAVAFRHAMPASTQGIHQLLEVNRSVFFLADEFAEWIRLTHKDATKQAALGYTMQAYSRATGTLEPGHAVTKEYKPVENPRLSILATSTAEAMFDTMTREQGDSGAYNRQVIFVGDEELPQKKYHGLVYEPEQHLIDFIRRLAAYPPGTQVTFSRESYDEFIKQDQELTEPIKRKDGLLGGRLAEQAIKMAGDFALSDERLTMNAEDIKAAFAIRVGLYHRVATLAQHRGCLDGLHHTTRALEQVTKVFSKKEGLFRSQIAAFSRLFNALTVSEQNLVVNTLIENGTAAPDKDKKNFLHSLVFEQ